MPKKICHDSCECHKCKTTMKKKKSKPKKVKIAREIIKSIMPNMRLMTFQPDYTIQNIPSQFNTPKDILDIKNSLIELMQKEKKKLSGVISTQTEDMHEIVDDMATEKAINSIGKRNNNETEYRPKSPKREKTFNTDFTTLDSPFDIGKYKAKSPKFEEKSNNDFGTSSDKFFARPQTSFKKSGLINDIDTPFIDPINGLWVHNQTQLFHAEVPDTIVKSLEKHKSQKTNTILFENSSSPITTGNAVFEEAFDAEYKPIIPNSVKSNNDFETLDSPLDFGIYNPKLPKREEKFNGFETLDSPLDFGIYNPKLPKREEKFNGFKTSSDKFFATPQTSFKADNKYNNPNIYIPPIPPPPSPEEFKLKDGKIKVKRMPRLSKKKEQNMFKNEDKPEHKPRRGRPKKNHSLIRTENNIL